MSQITWKAYCKTQIAGSWERTQEWNSEKFLGDASAAGLRSALRTAGVACGGQFGRREVTEKDGAQGHLECSHVWRRKKGSRPSNGILDHCGPRRKMKTAWHPKAKWRKRQNNPKSSVSDLWRENHYHCARGKQRRSRLEANKEHKRAQSQSCGMSER